MFSIIVGIIMGSMSVNINNLSYSSLKEGTIPLCRGIVIKSERKSNNYNRSSLLVRLSDYGQKVQIYVSGTKEFDVNNLIEIRNLRISLPKEAMNEGSFDYRRYLRSTGVKYVGNVSDKNIKIYGHGGAPAFREARAINSFLFTHIKNVFGENDVAGIIAGIFLGNKSLISPDVYDSMKFAGISHVMAVSGLHVMILMSALYLFLRGFIIRKKTMDMIIVAVLVLFSLITGMSSSVIRAVFMAALLFAGVSSLRDNDSVTTLSLAALVLCIVNPYVIYHTGFQMSFLATLSIVVVSKRLSDILKRFMPESLATSIAVSFSAQIGIFPVMIYTFGYITVYTLISNLVIIPLIPFVYLFGTLALITNVNPFIFIARMLVEFIIRFAKGIASLENNTIYFASGFFLSLTSVAIFLSFLYMFSGKKRLKKGAACLLMCMLVFSYCTWYNSRGIRDFTVTFINVGHGDCTLIRGINGENILIDTGTDEMAADEVHDYLKRHGINKLDCIVLSHFDSDHAGGFERLSYIFKPDEVIIPFADSSDSVKDFCRHSDITVREISKDHFFRLCGAEFEVLSPERDHNYNANDLSAVIMMNYQNSKWLFTGDASTSVLENIENPDADILKVSHHGDKKCTSESFISKVSPTACIISADGISKVGADIEVVNLLKEKSTLYTTYENKTITFICDKNGGIYFGKNKKPIKNRT